VTAFLIDEMFPAAAAEILRTKYGHDAVQAGEVGLRAADDTQVATAARAEGRAVVTGNAADFAAERDLVLVFVLKKNLPAGGGQAAALARILDRWDRDHPDPYLGHHVTAAAGGRGQPLREFALAASGDAGRRLDGRGEITSLVCR
jgi:hypothetical protein